MTGRVLILTYYWPPSGGAGVQRWLKFVKYLPHFGWQPIVYTADDAEYPVLDRSLSKDIPAGLEVIKTKVWEPYDLYKRFIGHKKEDKINAGFLSEKSKPRFTEKVAVWIRGNFFIPDARKFWIRPSIKFLVKYLNNNPVDAIISSGPPHSLHLIGMALRKKTNIPWIADFRDPWTGIDFYNDLHLGWCADRKHRRLEKNVLKSADEVIVISEGMRDDFNTIHQRRYRVITNGFDAEDIPSGSVELDHKFSLAHIGSLVKTRNPVLLWKVLKDIADYDKQFANDLEIKLVGKVDYFVSESIRQLDLEKYLKKIDYLPHDKVMVEQMKSQVLLLLINDTPNANLILTGKFFEYMAARRPVLCIGPPDGNAAKILEETKCGLISGFEDYHTLKENVMTLYKDYKSGTLTTKGKDIAKYSRESLTGKLAEILAGLCS